MKARQLTQGNLENNSKNNDYETKRIKSKH